MNAFYYERTIDHELRQKAREWVAGATWRLHVSITAPPGHGASALLEQFVQYIAGDREHFNRVRSIFIRPRGRSAQDSRADLSQIAVALAAFDATSEPGALESLLARWRNCPTPKRWALALGIPLGVIVLSLGFALNSYAGSNEARTLRPDTVRYWRLFLLDWLWQFDNWLTLGVGVVAMLIGAMGSALFRYFLPAAAPRRLNEGDAARLNAPETLVQLLERSGAGMRAVLLVVDDVYAMRAGDRELLQRVQRGALKRTRVLLVTRDLSEPLEYAAGDAGRLVSIHLPALSEGELRHILSVRARGMSAAELGRLVAQARQNLHALDEDVEDDAVRQGVLADFTQAYDADTEVEFGLARAMVYWAVAGEPFVTEQALARWMEQLDAELLAALQVRPPTDIPALIKAFRRSSIIRREGRTLHFDPYACHTLVGTLHHDAEAKDGETVLAKLVAEAHLSWAAQHMKELREPGGTVGFAPGGGRRGVVAHRAAHHVRHLRPALLPLHAQERLAREEDASRALVMSAAARRLEGEFDEGERDALLALDWASALPDGPRRAVEEAATGELWALYAMTWSPDVWAHLERLAMERETVTKTVSWVASESYRKCCLPGSAPVLGPVPVDAGAEAASVWTLADALARIRRDYGFVDDALADSSWAVPEPGPGGTWATLRVHELKTLAAIARDDGQASASLESWRAAAAAADADDMWVAEQALLEYQTARIEHIALSAAGSSSTAPTREQLEAIRASYSGVSATATLLGLRPLVADATRRAGDLLREHTPSAQREADSEWWQGWNDLYDITLRIESELGWADGAPAIHRARWNFFSKDDEETSLRDLYKTYRAVSIAGYPVPVLLQWHQQTAERLNNYGTTVEHREWSSELYETWASPLAALPAAVPYRAFKTDLALEQSYALLFASQARRLAGQIDAARRLLDRADALCAKAKPTGEDPGRVRGHRLSLRLQRYWLEEHVERSLIGKALGKGPEEILRHLWRELLREDMLVSNVLNCLVRTEVQREVASLPWPPPGSAAHEDPENPNLSLPAAWFDTPGMRVANRFEFRFLQMLAFVDLQPSSSDMDFLLRASAHWLGKDHFGDAALEMASVDLRLQFITHHRTAMIRLLSALKWYYRYVEPLDDKELSSMVHLIRYKPRAGAKDEYVDLLMRHEALIKREFVARLAVPRHWPSTVERFEHYFGVVVNSELFVHRMADALMRDGRSLGQEQSRHRKLREALAAAKSLSGSRRYAQAMVRMEPHLQASGTHGWLILEDVEAIDLWLHCASNSGALPERVAFWSGELPAVAQAMIRQLTSAVNEPRLERLAGDLLALLR